MGQSAATLGLLNDVTRYRYMMFLQCVSIGLPVQHLQCPFQQEEQNIDVSNQSEPLLWDD